MRMYITAKKERIKYLSNLNIIVIGGNNNQKSAISNGKRKLNLFVNCGPTKIKMPNPIYIGAHKSEYSRSPAVEVGTSVYKGSIF